MSIDDPKVLGYRAMVRFDRGSHHARELEYLTIEERHEYDGREDIVCAVYTALVPVASNPIAWLVEGVSPGPFITPDHRAAIGYLEQGATVHSLGLRT